MKLTSIAIEGYGVCSDLRLGQFNDGLNIIFGETGSGKTTIRNFIRGVTFGVDPNSTGGQFFDKNRVSGQIEVRHDNFEYRLARDLRLDENFSAHPLNSVGAPIIHSVGQLNGNLNLSLYDAVFNVEFHDTRANSANLAHQLHARLGVPPGSTGIRDEVAFQRWKQESDGLANQLIAIQRRIDSLTTEKRGFHAQIDQSTSLHDRQLVSIERQLSEVAAQIAEIDLFPTENRISNVKSEITKLRELIANSEVQYVPTTVTNSVIESYGTLYERLDEIENQIRRWRRVQSDIQSQRIRLRDEMLAWNDLTLESNEHPYHNARSILCALESKVEHVENHPASSANQLGNVCKQMRGDIQGLCHELGHQYKHIRHKAAAAELKQLRRCYNEMGENTERLIKRRESVIEEIERVDPAGAQAINRADQQFCQCAFQEGHLEARRRFVGSLPPVVQPAEPGYSVVRPDLSSHRNRLADLERQLSQDQAALNRLESQRNDLRLCHTDWVSQRDRLLAQINHGELLARIENIDVELRLSTDQYNDLSRRNESMEFIDAPTNPILEQAASYLGRMSLGDLSKSWLGDQPGEIFAQDRFNNVVRFDSLSRGQQDLVYLSLCLAAVETLARQGITSPMLLDDVFANLDPQRVSATLDVVHEHGRRGHQIVAFTKTNELDRPSNSPHVTVFELPPTVAPAPFSSPERQPFIPIREPNWESSLANEHQFFSSYRDPAPTFSENKAPLAYPLTKYPRVGPRDTVSPALFDEVANSGPDFQPETRFQTVKAFTESTRLGNEGIVESADLGHLDRFAINTVSELLDVDADNLSDDFIQLGIDNRKIDRWQAQYWLLICVPGMTTTDTQVLYACGITEPEQLDTTNSHQLLERIQSYLSTVEGRGRNSLRDYSNESINRWYRALDTTRSHWNRGNGDSRRWRNQRNRKPRLRAFGERDQSQRIPDEPVRAQAIAAPPARVSQTRSSRASRVPSTTTPMVQNFTERQRSARRVAAVTSQSDTPANGPATSDSTGNRKLKFFLELDDHLESAPSIGNRTAERFEKIGVVKIRDLLKNTAESMAAKINYKRITEKVIRNWQHQTRLVCRIPNLRGHDAQLLVACGITEPEDISIMQPNKLLDIIGPFSDTKEGLKIIRQGKKPDLDEIKDWIDWAGNTRSLQAA